MRHIVCDGVEAPCTTVGVGVCIEHMQDVAPVALSCAAVAGAGAVACAGWWWDPPMHRVLVWAMSVGVMSCGRAAAAEERGRRLWERLWLRPRTPPTVPSDGSGSAA